MYFFLLFSLSSLAIGDRNVTWNGWLIKVGDGWHKHGKLVGIYSALISRVCCGCGCLHAGVVFLKNFILNHGRDGYATGSSLAIDLWGDGLGSE
jgi:hypothetical protein